MNLPAIRSGERMDYKRCPKKWYWAWRKGLVPRTARFGALDLGTWVHTGLANWYGEGFTRHGKLIDHFMEAHDEALAAAMAAEVPDYVIDQAEPLMLLGAEMMKAYQKHYSRDREINVLKAEIPLEFVFSEELRDGGWKPLAVHKLKPDLVFFDSNMDVWLMEHKTAKQVQMEHLIIDDQARPYGAMAERSLRKMGLIKKGQKFRGILYNFLRKALPDERPQNAEGKYLNQDLVTVSKRQPSPFFVRKQVTLTSKAKLLTLLRVQAETKTITDMALMLRKDPKLAQALPKTPHKSCPKTCQFFSICVAEEEGTDIRQMERTMFQRRNPYMYEEESTEERLGFEIA